MKLASGMKPGSQALVLPLTTPSFCARPGPISQLSHLTVPTPRTTQDSDGAVSSRTSKLSQMSPVEGRSVSASRPSSEGASGHIATT